MYAFTYAHQCIHLQVLLRAYVFESHKISIYKKIVVFSVFLPENYLDEVAIWGSKSDGVDSCRGYSSLHILNVGPLSDARVTDIFPSVCLLLNFLERLFGGSLGRGGIASPSSLTEGYSSSTGGRSSSLTDWQTDQQSGQLQEGSTSDNEEGRELLPSQPIRQINPGHQWGNRHHSQITFTSSKFSCLSTNKTKTNQKNLLILIKYINFLVPQLLLSDSRLWRFRVYILHFVGWIHFELDSGYASRHTPQFTFCTCLSSCYTVIIYSKDFFLSQLNLFCLQTQLRSSAHLLFNIHSSLSIYLSV